MKPHDRAPNGRFVDDLILFGSPERGACAARGFWIEPPDLRGASYARLNEFQDKLRPVLDGVVKELGVGLLFSAGDAGAIFIDPSLDITGEVIKRFDAAKPAAAGAKPAPAAGAKPKVKTAGKMAMPASIETHRSALMTRKAVSGMF